MDMSFENSKEYRKEDKYGQYIISRYHRKNLLLLKSSGSAYDKEGKFSPAELKLRIPQRINIIFI